MNNSGSIQKQIEAHKSKIISEINQTEEAVKIALKRHEKSLMQLIANDEQRLKSFLEQQEQEQMQSLQKLISTSNLKVMIFIAVLSMILGMIFGTVFAPTVTISLQQNLNSEWIVPESMRAEWKGKRFVKAIANGTDKSGNSWIQLN